MTYFEAGTSFYIKASGGARSRSLEALCGHKVAVENGTTQQADATAQSKKCTNAGKPAIAVHAYPDQNGANLALPPAGPTSAWPTPRLPPTSSSSPTASSSSRVSAVRYRSVRHRGPQGVRGWRRPILAALKKLIADGIYTQILKKWGVQAGAITQPRINGATS